MSKFTQQNFYLIINEIQAMELAQENIWVPIGILEVMYDDDYGYIDQYFHSEIINRNKEDLWHKLQGHQINKKF